MLKFMETLFVKLLSRTPGWSCDEMFATNDQGFIPEHNCAKPSPVHSPKSVRPGPKPPIVLKKPVRMLDGSPVWSSGPK